MKKFDAIVIPAAGKGSRFHELGKLYPKCCLPYLGKPIIAHIVEKAYTRTNKVIIAVANDQQKESILDSLFLVGIREVEFVVLKPAYTDGPAGTLAEVMDSIDGKVLVLLSDAIPSEDLPYPSITGSNRIWYTNVQDWERWCMVTETKEGVTFFDKPQVKPPTEKAACGIYEFEASEFRSAAKQACYLNQGLEFQLSHVFENMVFQLEELKGEMLDFGTLQDFIKAKKYVKTRSFNSIELCKGSNNTNTIIKGSSNLGKILQEAAFIRNLPESVANYFPTVKEIRYDKSQYTMEMINAPTLREIALFVDGSYSTWLKIFRSIEEYFGVVSMYKTGSPYDFWFNIFSKNLGRFENLKSYEWFEQTDESKFLTKLHLECSETFASEGTLYHGDLHFANMFYDFDKSMLKLVDPRGEFIGHTFYDMAKLYHSVFGYYDFIDQGLYAFDTNGEPYYYDKGMLGVRNAFVDVFGEPTRLLKDLTASLFLSMIPLHTESEEKQKLFFLEYKRLRK
jgi:dTDP-glucose pyrophosphorylase